VEILEDRRLLNADAILELSALRRLADSAALRDVSMAADDNSSLGAIPDNPVSNAQATSMIKEEPANPVDLGASKNLTLEPTREIIRDDQPVEVAPPIKVTPVDDTAPVDPIDPPMFAPPIVPPIGKVTPRPEHPDLHLPLMQHIPLLPVQELLLSEQQDQMALPPQATDQVAPQVDGAGLTTAEHATGPNDGGSQVQAPEAQAQDWLQAGLAAALLGLNDAGMYTVGTMGADAAMAIADTGILALSTLGIEPMLEGAGLAEYIPSLEAAALTFALQHQLSTLELNDQFFSLLSELSWKHVAAAGIVVGAGYLVYQGLKPRRRGIWTDLGALAWNPQFATVPVTRR
jgi:hypothetical protein